MSGEVTRPSGHSLVDLHIHTTASDGQLSPTEVVQTAIASGMVAIAITDHDTTDGIEEALAAAKGTELEVIPGVEVSADVSPAEVHILGYYLEHQNLVLGGRLATFREARLRRAQRMVEKLAGLGLPLNWERVQTIAGEASVGRPHVARALLEKGYVSSVDEAFDRYIRRNGPAYVDRFKIKPAEAVRLVLAAGGVPVLAHPLYVSHLVPGLVPHGLCGLEAYYSGYTPDETRFLLGLCAKYGLVATGGTDFHGDVVQPGHEIGGVIVPPELLKGLRARRERLQARAPG